MGCFRLAMVTAAAIAATACASATMTVSSHLDRGVDFARYGTYDWGPADALPSGDVRFDRDPSFQDHMQGAIEKQLARKGLERATSGSPDLLIHYHTSVDQRIDVNRLDRDKGYCPDSSCGGIEYVEMGTLVIDIVDARSNRLVWRGWSQDALNDVFTNRDRMAKRVDESVARMFERWPRHMSRSMGAPLSQTRNVR